MFKKLKINTLLLFIPLTTLAFCFNSPKNDDEKMSTIMISVKNTLSYLHYSPRPINDAYSADVYKQYFDMIDASKRYFLQSDMNEFEAQKKSGKCSGAFCGMEKVYQIQYPAGNGIAFSKGTAAKGKEGFSTEI